MYKRKREMNDAQGATGCSPASAELNEELAPGAAGCSPASAERNEELAAIEAELAALVLSPARLDRDRTMFLAGQASASCQTSTAAAKPHARIWPIGCVALTAVSVCLLLAIVSQRRELIALRTAARTEATQPLTVPLAVRPQAEKSISPLAEPSWMRQADLSQTKLLALADAGPLSVRSLAMADEPSAKKAPAGDWPQQAYGSPSPPQPYYKLLRQLQHQEIQ